ncbi:MAG: RnfH family protein [Lysobacterales bacterium CG17_big_fil_post_rev_8_21_14_2_50_64_11]|nr:MAG: RnfH family protein [Xanthomonadales bacterium CG17_big_fil_post_rev_8_21_14_2_50_64_11]
MSRDAPIQVQVVYALPERQWLLSLQLPGGSTAAEALAASGLADQVPGYAGHTHTLAIYAQPVASATVLKTGDRLEVLRPLLADPKQVRRVRARKA